MKINTIKVFLLLFLATNLTGCLSNWVKPKDKQMNSPGKRFTIVLPDGWIRYVPDRRAITLTKDGLNVNKMRFGYYSYSKLFKPMKNKPNAKSNNYELSEYLIALLGKFGDTRFAEVIENRPALINGIEGYRVLISYRDEDGLRLYRLIYAFGAKQGLYYAIYQAPLLHYFERDLPSFTQTINSLKIAKE